MGMDREIPPPDLIFAGCDSAIGGGMEISVLALGNVVLQMKFALGNVVLQLPRSIR